MKKLILAILIVCTSLTACDDGLPSYNAVHSAHETGDYATAFKLAQSLATQADAKSQTALGLMYLNGQDVPQDYASAVFWFTKAAQQGQPNALLSLGILYHNGQDIARDYAAARLWYDLAASQTEDDEIRLHALQNLKVLDEQE